MPKYDLKTPCRNCPFRNDSTRIRFRVRERAEEIEEQAYRRGFPCHLSADLIESDEVDEGGYVFGANTQHCVGYTILAIKDNGGAGGWPGIENDEDLAERTRRRTSTWMRRYSRRCKNSSTPTPETTYEVHVCL